MKHIKWFLLSSFLILFFGVCQIVNAESCSYNYVEQLFPVLNQTKTASIGNNVYDINLTSNWTISNENYQYIKLNAYYNIRNVNELISNIDLDYTCGQHTTIPHNESYTIRYADGTTATISGQASDTICRDYNTNGSATYNFRPEVTNLQIALVNTNNQYFMCSTDSNGNAVCPIIGNQTIKAIRFYINTSYSSSTTINFGLLTRFLYFCNSDEKAINKSIEDVNENITSSDVSGASQDQNNFVNNSAFQDNTGLSGIITAPLSMISSLTNQCQPIQLTLPYLNDTNVSIPCMGDFLQQKVPALITIIKVVVNGFICYLIGLDLFKIVKNARDPDNDRIEVLDL